jgi:phasin protein
VTDFASVQKNLTAITTAQTDFAKSSFEASKAYFEKLASVKSPDKFFELWTEIRQVGTRDVRRRSDQDRRTLQDIRQGSLHPVYFELPAEVSA